MSSAMNVPNLSRKLTLEAPMRVPDGAGGHARTWTPLGVIWADIRTSTGREAADVAGPLSRVALRIIVRAAPDGAPSRPVPEQRFREGMHIYRILSVSPTDGAPKYLTCQAVEEVVA